MSQPKFRTSCVDRFLRYVKIDTASDRDSTSFPSTEKQKDLSRLLVGELQALGLDPLRGDSLVLGYERRLSPREAPASFANLVGVVRGRGSGARPVLIGAHYDSAIDAPCSDDNAAAVAVAGCLMTSTGKMSGILATRRGTRRRLVIRFRRNRLRKKEDPKCLTRTTLMTRKTQMEIRRWSWRVILVEREREGEVRARLNPPPVPALPSSP